MNDSASQSFINIDFEISLENSMGLFNLLYLRLKNGIGKEEMVRFEVERYHQNISLIINL